MKYSPTFKNRFREASHYVSSSIMLKNSKFLLESPCKWLTFFAIPFGALIFIYIQYTHESTVSESM